MPAKLYLGVAVDGVAVLGVGVLGVAPLHAYTGWSVINVAATLLGTTQDIQQSCTWARPSKA